MISQFTQSMERAGLSTDQAIIADSELHRFRVHGDRPGTRNGWYVLHPDLPPAGAFGCWKRIIRITWTGNRSAAAMQTAHCLAAAADNLGERHAHGRRLALAEWTVAQTAPEWSRYLQSKKVCAYGIRYSNNALLVPLRDTKFELHGLQRIYPNGDKRFTYGSDKIGHFHLIGALGTSALCIAEGYATAATIHQVTGLPVAVAFDAGNLLPVAEALRDAYPEHQLLICADDDRWEAYNTGLTSAWQAAEALGGELVVPEFTQKTGPGTDFNDLFIEKGAAAVLRCFKAAGRDYV